MEEATEIMDSGDQLDIIHSDMSKAFDSVNFEILLEKIQASGISGKVIKWLRSYLIGRSQSVKINGYVSFIFKCLSGVP